MPQPDGALRNWTTAYIIKLSVHFTLPVHASPTVQTLRSLQTPALSESFSGGALLPNGFTMKLGSSLWSRDSALGRFTDYRYEVRRFKMKLPRRLCPTWARITAWSLYDGGLSHWPCRPTHPARERRETLRCVVQYWAIIQRLGYNL